MYNDNYSTVFILSYGSGVERPELPLVGVERPVLPLAGVERPVLPLEGGVMLSTPLLPLCRRPRPSPDFLPKLPP